MSPFWELLEIISQADAAKLLDLETEEATTEEAENEKHLCVYCGGEFKEKGLKRHYTFCKDAPSSSK